MGRYYARRALPWSKTLRDSCKQHRDVERGSRYANRIVEIICGGDISRLQRCAETSFVSYFAAPKEAVLQAQLAELPEEMRAEHRALTQLDIGTNSTQAHHLYGLASL